MSDAELEEPASSEITLVKIEAEYEGSTEAGTVLYDDNPGISVTDVCSDGTTEKLYNFEYGIEKPVTLKAGKSSTVYFVQWELAV